MRIILRVAFLTAFAFLFLVGNGQVIYTVAGNNKAADNIAANTSIIMGAMGVAVNNSGNVYIADFNESRIRKINTSGNITTVTGYSNTTNPYYSGDGGSATPSFKNNSSAIICAAIQLMHH